MVRRWAWVGIVLFVVADAVLIVIALQHTRDGADSAPPYAPVVASSSEPGTSMTPPPTTPATRSSTPPAAAATRVSVTTTTTATTTTSTASTSTTTTSTSTAAEAPGLAATVLLDMASDGSAIRATRGSCTAGRAAKTVVQVSGDAGDTWTTVDAAVTAVQRVAASRGGKSWFVATDADCTLVEHDSAGDGKDWSTSSPDGAWSLPVDVAATSILAPAGDVEMGCTPVSLAAIDPKNAVVACRDGALRITTDSGKTWADGARVPGVVGISFVGPNSGFALAVSDGCRAQLWRTTDGAASFTKLACLAGTAPQAITAAGSTILVQVDGAMQRSDDEGDTWSRIP